MVQIRSVISPALCILASLGVSLGLKLTPQAKIDSALTETKTAAEVTLGRLEAQIETDCIFGVSAWLGNAHHGCAQQPNGEEFDPAVNVDLNAGVAAGNGDCGDCASNQSGQPVQAGVDLTVGSPDGAGGGPDQNAGGAQI